MHHDTAPARPTPPEPHSLPIRVYYEDTDAGGVVYYASYWRFCERARTEWLRALGVDQHALMDDRGLAFVVRSVQGDYLKPARLDDMITVTTETDTVRRASLIFLQHVTRGAEVLFSARVTVACVDLRRSRPVPIPDILRRSLSALA